MILVDVNLLLYAINRSSPHHEAARIWLDGLLDGPQPIGLPWLVLLAFLRLSTNRRIFPQPLSVEQALALIDGWLEHPNVRLLEPGADHWPRLKGLLASLGAAGNLTSDAHLAALALEHAAELHSTDNDFSRFAGVRWVNPLA